MEQWWRAKIKQISKYYELPLRLNGKESACNAGATGNMGSTPGLGRSPGGGHGNLHLYSCLENPMDTATGQAIVHGATKKAGHD